MKDDGAVGFFGLLDLASGALGGRAIATNDDFFATVENLTKPGRGVFIEDKYTDRGKWMDGWESRRKRGPGHDWAVLALGVPGTIRALDIDTNHFLGNHAPYASVEAVNAPGASDDEVVAMEFREILSQVPLRPGSQNLFTVTDGGSYSHVRLRIFPDGGVARFRVYGLPTPTWEPATDPKARPGEVDLVGARNGGVALACSDSFFSPMANLTLPERPDNMGGGWESRRRRGPGHDWVLLRLGAPGTIHMAEVDTSFFKGNFPDRVSLEGISAPEASITELLASDEWKPILPEQSLRADERHYFREEITAVPGVTHVRLHVFPDGGIARLRLYGTR
ncbi:MAG: allantoicase [Myxococcales bacterium]|nr:allantoicase [Myxococcales bacterium]